MIVISSVKDSYRNLKTGKKAGMRVQKNKIFTSRESQHNVLYATAHFLKQLSAFSQTM
jgi:hypothetical protein